VTAKTWLAAAIMFLAPPVARSLAAQDLPRVMIQTELGSMEVVVDTIGSPDAAGNFLDYVDHGGYRGGHFHRTVRAERQRAGKAEIEGIQGGVNPSHSKDVPLTPDFFIRVGAQTELGRVEPNGRGFTPFGRVVRGREVVRLIHTARAKDHRLTPPVGIISITRVR